jgi:simple sugar transport system permease protein
VSTGRIALATSVAAGALAAFTGLVLLAGASPASALASLAEGAVGSRAALGETMTRATSLVLLAVGAAVAFRAGALNMGAAAAAAVGPGLGGAPGTARVALLVAAAVAGALAAAPAVWLAERRGVPPVLSTILLNLVAAAAVTWLVRGPLQDPAGDYPQSRPLAAAVRFEPLFAGGRTTAAFPMALLLAAGAGVVLSRTPVGLTLRAAGAAPEAARAIGLDDAALRAGAFLASGAFAGLAGGLEVVAVTGRLFDPFSAGVGYLGIAAALLGGTRAGGATAAALFLAALGAGSGAMQRDTGVPSAIAAIVPGLLVLAVLLGRRRLGPEHA